MGIKPLNVIIVGCGKIAGGLDQGSTNRKAQITHAGVLSRDKRFKIKTCVDADSSLVEAFQNYWNIDSAFNALSKVKATQGEYDVVCVCTTTKAHYEALDWALRINPKLIFCEKPITTNLKLTESYIEKLKKNKIRLLVNYTRRWDMTVSRIKKNLHNNNWGRVKVVNCIYNKGLYNNGSHLIDLIENIFGDVRVYSVGEPIYDYFTEDPSIPFILKDGSGVLINVTCGDASDYAIFEMRILTEAGEIAMENSGRDWTFRAAEESRFFPGYRELGFREYFEGQYDKCMSNAIDNIYRSVVFNDKLICSGEVALKIQATCEEIAQLSEWLKR